VSASVAPSPWAPASERIAQIVAAAREILETEGPDALTMRHLAARLGIQAPSLYKHVANKEQLEVLLLAEVLRDWGATLHAAVDGLSKKAGRGAGMTALATTYRSWALAHPHLYRLATEGELPRDRLPEGLEAWAAEPVVRVAGSQARGRAAWAFAHGMTILELDGRFPPGADLEAAWSEGVRALART
jgi:AcrR family transcriptional regulator